MVDGPVGPPPRADGRAGEGGRPEQAGHHLQREDSWRVLLSPGRCRGDVRGVWVCTVQLLMTSLEFVDKSVVNKTNNCSFNQNAKMRKPAKTKLLNMLQL